MLRSSVDMGGLIRRCILMTSLTVRMVKGGEIHNRELLTSAYF